MTHEQALGRLLAGNERFVAGRPEHPAQAPDRREALASGQTPWAIVHGCADSRVPPELLFDAGLGELFVTRVAGNIADVTSLASMEYGVAHLAVPLLVVLGHSSCGAVTAALQGGPPEGHLGALIDALEPPLRRAPAKAADRVGLAVRANVEYVVAALEASEPILAPAVREGRLRIVGMIYDLASGRVECLA